MKTVNSVSRRFAVMSMGACACLALNPFPVSAGGDGGNAAAKQQESNSTTKRTKKPAQDKKTVLITRTYFKKISQSGFKELIQLIDSGQDAKVEGFSTRFSRHLFETALFDKDFVATTINEISQSRNVKERKDYLLSLRYDVENPYDDLVQPANMTYEEFQESIARQETPEVLRTRKAKVRLLKKWRWSPREGMLPN